MDRSAVPACTSISEMPSVDLHQATKPTQCSARRCLFNHKAEKLCTRMIVYQLPSKRAQEQAFAQRSALILHSAPRFGIVALNFAPSEGAVNEPTTFDIQRPIDSHFSLAPDSSRPQARRKSMSPQFEHVNLTRLRMRSITSFKQNVILVSHAILTLKYWAWPTYAYHTNDTQLLHTYAQGRSQHISYTHYLFIPNIQSSRLAVRSGPSRVRLRLFSTK